MNQENNRELEHEIRELQKQIALLSMQLGVKKMESRHPSLEKLANEFEASKNYMETELHKLSEFGRQKLGDITLRKAACATGLVLLIGSAGYAILCFMGILGCDRRVK